MADGELPSYWTDNDSKENTGVWLWSMTPLQKGTNGGPHQQ